MMKKKEIAEAVQQGFMQAERPAPQPVESAPADATPRVKQDVVQPAPTPELNPRNRAFKEISERANAEADANAKETLPSTDEEGNPPAPPAVEAAAVEEAPAPQGAAPEAPTEEPAPVEAAAPAPAESGPNIDPNAEYSFVVDGVPIKIKGSQVVSRVQKGEAADYRLQLATHALELARQQQPAPAAPTPQGAAKTPAATPEGSLSDVQLAEMVQFGTPEQGAKAIAEIRKREPNTLTAEGMQEFMRQELPKIVRAETAFAEATRFVKAEYGDLLADPYISTIFFAEEDKRRAAGSTKPYVDLYREIGDDLRKHFSKPKPTGANPPAALKQPAPAAPTVAERQQAKAAAPAAPRLASARLEGGSGEAKPKTREQIIQGMQESRGQRPVNRI